MVEGIWEYGINTAIGSSFAGASSPSAYPMSNKRFIFNSVVNSPLPSTSTSVGVRVMRRSAAVVKSGFVFSAFALNDKVTGMFLGNDNCVGEDADTLQSLLSIVSPGINIWYPTFTTTSWFPVFMMVAFNSRLSP